MFGGSFVVGRGIVVGEGGDEVALPVPTHRRETRNRPQWSLTGKKLSLPLKKGYKQGGVTLRPRQRRKGCVVTLSACSIQFRSERVGT